MTTAQASIRLRGSGLATTAGVLLAALLVAFCPGPAPYKQKT